MTDNYDYRPAFKSLENALRTVSGQIEHVSGQVISVDHHVDAVEKDLTSTRTELAELRSQFDEFAQQAARTAAVQQSETKVGNLRAQLDREFGHYAVVRRTSVGMLHAFDIGNVSNQTVQNVSEELMIQSPRYWLAPALVALAAWSRDNKDLADRSVKAAFERDPSKTSLFFALVLRRQGRSATSVRWLRHYLSSFDPRHLTREFAVILEATSFDAFGPEGQALLHDRVATWCDQLRSDAGIVESQAQRWFREIGIHRQSLDSSTYPRLAALSPQFDDVQSQLERASALPAVLAKYTSVWDDTELMPARLEDLLDDILDMLVTEFDEVELPLRREVLYHESVIEEGGNVDRARTRSAALETALEDTVDVVSLQTVAATDPDLLGVGRRTQRLAVGVGQRDFLTAIGRYCLAYRSDLVDSVVLDFSPAHSEYARSFGFAGVRLDTTMPEPDGVRLLADAWSRTMVDRVAELTFSARWYLKPGAILAALALMVILIDPLVGLLALLAGGAVVFGVGEMVKRKANEAVAKIRDAEARALDVSVTAYRDAVAEFVDARLVFEELDAVETELVSLVRGWPTAVAGGQQDDRMVGAS